MVVHHQLPEFTQTHAHRVGDAIQPSHPLSSLLLLPPIPPSIRVFSNESTLCIRWPKYWSFSFSISPFNEHPGLISFRMDWLDLPAVQGTLKSLLQHHSSKASILWCSAFSTVQLSHPIHDYQKHHSPCITSLKSPDTTCCPNSLLLKYRYHRPGDIWNYRADTISKFGKWYYILFILYKHMKLKIHK